MAERGGRGRRWKAGAAAGAEKLFARSRLAGRNEQSGQQAELLVSRQGTDQRRGEQFADRGSGGAAEWNEPHCLPVSARCRTKGADVVRTGCSRSMAGHPQPAAAGERFFQPPGSRAGRREPEQHRAHEPEFRRLDGI